jgi:hypothetical protein
MAMAMATSSDDTDTFIAGPGTSRPGGTTGTRSITSTRSTRSTGATTTSRPARSRNACLRFVSALRPVL